jgi:acyl-CoA synthetase (AMP-forming)/AMP-acid ligase II
MASTRPGLPDLTPGQPLVLLFTAGTTGAPKAVPLSHASFTSYLLENVNPADPDIHQTALLSMPLFHVAGFQSLLSAIYGGRTTVLLSQFRAPDWLVAVERHRVTHAVVVPTMLKQVLDHPAFGSTDLSSLQQVTYGAAAMPLPVIRQAIERLPHVRFMNAFGQTETASTITALGPEDHRLDGPPHQVERKLQRLAGSIGKPLAGVEVAVVDGDGQPVAPGTVGQIAARGERVMRGYWNRPDTEGPVLANGWILTGDLGWMDEDGYFFLAGRERDIIKRGGEMISPEEVENVLLLHPGVADVAVIGIRDEEWGERVRAIVVPAGGEKPSPEELIEFCRSRLASYKKPESVVFAKGLPRNDLGKLLRQQLRQQYG